MAAASNTSEKWLWEDGDRLYIALSVQPGAKQDRVKGVHGERLKIAVKAPPLEGRANEAVVEFLAALLRLPKRAVSVRHGESSREKLIAVTGLTLQAAEQILKAQFESV